MTRSGNMSGRVRGVAKEHEKSTRQLLVEECDYVKGRKVGV